MRKNFKVLLGMMILIPMSFGLHSQTLEVSGSLFLPQDSIGFTYTDPAFTSTDWIGIYLVDQAPGGPQASSWDYVTSAAGTMNLAAPQVAGNYKAFLLCCDGYDTIAISGEFSVEEPYLTTSYPAFLEGDEMSFGYKSPKFTETDRVAIYAQGTTPGESDPPIDSKYITESAGTITLQTALEPGIYDAYLLCCDGYEVIASCSFEVLAETEAFVFSKLELYDPGATLEFYYNDPSYAEGDWIGIYDEYSDPTAVPSITWSQLVSKSGFVSFPGNIPSGAYIAVLFCCSTTDVEYTRSEAFEIDYSDTETYIKTTSSVYPEYTEILVNYKDADYADTDWIGIYHSGEIPGGGTESIDWAYIESDSGTIQFDTPLIPGDYELFLLCCDGYTVKAKQSFQVVDTNSPYIVSTKYGYTYGEPFEFSFNSPDFSATDWIGIYNMGEVPGGDGVYSIIWKYLEQSGGIMIFAWPDDYGPNGPTETPIPPGEYWAGLFCCDAYGLYAMSSFIVTEDNVGVKPELKTADHLSISPNPSTGHVNISLDGGEKMQRIVVYGITGQILYQESLDGSVNEKILELNSSKGLFFVEVWTATSRMSKKLIIQ